MESALTGAGVPGLPKNVQTGNGERPLRVLWQGQVCQVCQNCADLERRRAMESALTGVGVPGLSKPCRPGTGTCHRSSSMRGERSKSVKRVQTGNGEGPWKAL